MAGTFADATVVKSEGSDAKILNFCHKAQRLLRYNCESLDPKEISIEFPSLRGAKEKNCAQKFRRFWRRVSGAENSKAWRRENLDFSGALFILDEIGTSIYSPISQSY